VAFIHCKTLFLRKWYYFGLPTSVPFIGFKRAKQPALKAIRTADLSENGGPLANIESQKEKMRKVAITKWAERRHQSPRISLAYKRRSPKYQTGRARPTFQTTHTTTTTGAGPGSGAKTPILQGHYNDRTPDTAEFSMLSPSTLYRFITGNAFIEAYTQTFSLTHARTGGLPLASVFKRSSTRSALITLPFLSRALRTSYCSRPEPSTFLHKSYFGSWRRAPELTAERVSHDEALHRPPRGGQSPRTIVQTAPNPNHALSTAHNQPSLDDFTIHSQAHVYTRDRLRPTYSSIRITRRKA
jgi:hypothetical protein